MRDKTSREISAEPVGFNREGKPEFLITSVSYDKGGTTLGTLMVTGKRETRGYWLTVRFEARHDGMRSFTLFSGCKAFLEPAARFSAARLAKIPVPEETLAKLKEKVLGDREADIAKRNR